MKTEDTFNIETDLHPQTRIGNIYSTITNNEIIKMTQPLGAGDTEGEDDERAQT
jgi:hypothetical protein